MNIVVSIVRAIVDPVASTMSFKMFSAITFAELVVTSIVVVILEGLHHVGALPKVRKWLYWSLVPLVLIAVMLIIYRFDRLA